MVASARARQVTASVEVSGRDSRRSLVPIVFVHDPSMTTVDPVLTRAHLLLAQAGEDVALTSDLRAARWGLSTPMLRVPGAFSGDGTGEVHLQASVMSDRWGVQWTNGRDASPVHSTVMRLSPAIGWTLLQTVVAPSATVAPVLSLLWLGLWFVPLGMWTSVSKDHGLLHAVGRAPLVSCGVLGVGIAAALATGTAALSPLASFWCLVCSVGGALVRHRTARRRSAVHRR
jgi:hypothetical protein